MIMTTQESIDVLNMHLARLMLSGAGATPGIIEAVTEALEVLREKAEREDPKPLTIAELREMNGLPVWVKELSELRDNTGWALIEVADRGNYKGVPFVKCHVCTWNVVSRNLHCYRHKPKGE